MTFRIIERLKASKTVDQIVICTSSHADDNILVELAEKWGVEAIAGSELDVLSRLIEASNKFDADIVIRVTGDNPFTDEKSLDKTVKHLIEKNADYTRMIGLPIGVTADVMSSKMLKKLYSIIPDPNQSEYLQLFAIDPDHFYCDLLDAPPELNRPFYSLTVDTPDDIKFARNLYKNIPSKSGYPSIIDVVNELDQNPNYTGIDPHTPVKMPGGKTVKYVEFLDWLSQRTEASRNNI